jgi:hypothetical protein
MNTDPTNNPLSHLSDREIGSTAYMQRHTQPELAETLTPIQRQWYNFQYRFSHFNEFPELVERHAEYMADFKPQYDTPQHRIYAVHRMREYVCGEPTMILNPPTYAWEVALCDYMKCPEYTNEAAVKARLRQEKELKKSAPKDVNTAIGVANKEWRDAIRNQESATIYWRQELEKLTSRHEEELKAFRAARDENISGWKSYVASLREKYRQLRGQ